ncbi:hypothetical protein HanRHA438_Chr01g0001331 [Helianthus annuus]|nr:hypothetical protein HanRHA438_Chr01g0001331 [Helianthus annuus]
MGALKSNGLRRLNQVSERKYGRARVNSYGTNLTTLKSRRDSLYSKLSEVLVAKV